MATKPYGNPSRRKSHTRRRNGRRRLDEALTRYRGLKGNLRFPLDEPIPYKMIERVMRLRETPESAKANTQNWTKKSRNQSSHFMSIIASEFVAQMRLRRAIAEAAKYMIFRKLGDPGRS